jgi:hypothetical protein
MKPHSHDAGRETGNRADQEPHSGASGFDDFTPRVPKQLANRSQFTPRSDGQLSDDLAEALATRNRSLEGDPERAKKILLEEAEGLLGGDTPAFRRFRDRFLRSPTISTAIRGDVAERLVAWAIFLALWRTFLVRWDLRASPGKINLLGRAAEVLDDLGETRLATEVGRMAVRLSSMSRAPGGPRQSPRTRLIIDLEETINLDGKPLESLFPKRARRIMIARIASDFTSRTTVSQVRDILKDKRRRVARK